MNNTKEQLSTVDEAARRAAEKIFQIVKDKFDYNGTVQDCENTTASLAEIISTELNVQPVQAVDAKIMTDAEWEGLSAESRFRVNEFVRQTLAASPVQPEVSRRDRTRRFLLG